VNAETNLCPVIIPQIYVAAVNFFKDVQQEEDIRGKTFFMPTNTKP
jgi:hypothetical protein